MSNFMIILDILVVTGLCVSAILACHLEKLLSAVIALSVTGLFAAAAFLVGLLVGIALLLGIGRRTAGRQAMRLSLRIVWWLSLRIVWCWCLWHNSYLKFFLLFSTIDIYLL